MSKLQESKLIESIDLLNRVKSPEKIVNDPDCFSSLIYIKSSLFTIPDLDYAIFLDKSPFDQTLADLMAYLTQDCDQFDVAAYVAKTEGPGAAKLEMFFILLSLVNILVSKSIRFNVKINKTSIIESHVKLLQSDSFVDKCLTNKLLYFYEFGVSNVNWMSRYCGEEVKTKWLGLGVVGHLIKVSKKFDTCVTSAYQAIANIITEKQLDEVDAADISFGIKALARTLKTISNALVNKKSSIVDDTLEVIVNEKAVQKQAHFIVGKGRQSVFGIVQALYKFSVNDRIKEEIYFGYKIKEDFKNIIDNSFPIERRLTVKFIAHLSFNKKIGADLVQDKAYMEFINKLITEDETLPLASAELPDQTNCHKVVKLVVKHYG